MLFSGDGAKINNSFDFACLGTTFGFSLHHNIIASSFADSISSSTPPSPTTTPSSSWLNEA
jgi:hypothetical protein